MPHACEKMANQKTYSARRSDASESEEDSEGVVLSERSIGVIVQRLAETLQRKPQAEGPAESEAPLGEQKLGKRDKI